MPDPAWANTAQRILRREQRSLLQYVNETFPWSRPGEESAVRVLRQIIEEEQAADAGLARSLEKRYVPLPPLGTYPVSFTSLAFVSIDYLLPHLVQYQRQLISELERDARAIADAEARQQVQDLLQLKRRHLETLEELAAKANKPIHA
jgi:hypothetical protein